MRYILKFILLIALALLIVLLVITAWLWPRYQYLPPVQPGFELERFAANPIISSDMHPRLSAAQSEGGYANINGPSVLRVPEWVENPLGRYYLYFAHHKGNQIRLAYADTPTGPWTLYEPGALSLEDSGFAVEASDGRASNAMADLWRTFSIHVVRDYLLLSYRATVSDQKVREQRGIKTGAFAMPHIASPEVVVDEEKRRFILYFHGFSGRGYQHSRVARSGNGLAFEVLDEPVFSTYLRGFDFRGQHYLLGMPGVLYRSDRPDGGFLPRDRLLFEPDMRHAALWVERNTLHVLWSRVGDVPEAILYSCIDMSSENWDKWRATEAVEVLRPALPWEGSELPLLPSLRGEIDVATRELRDPYLFRDSDGHNYLYYVGAGEKAIGVAQVQPDFQPSGQP